MPDNHASTRIKKLSPLLINQLAAGEVVTRPAAVVKELLENAIDADATHIEIRVTQGGMSMIEVVDNGIGIHPDDMVMAVTRHATSKVADVAHLHGITTLGFRGEALAAMAAVSRLTLTSSHDDSGIGRQLQVAGVLGDTTRLTPVVHNRGTTITVKDLYFNVPARRGNLKSVATEFNHIETMVREVALARADVMLELFHDNKKRLSLSASAEINSRDNPNRLPLSRLEQATGMLLSKNALEVSIDLSSLMQQSVAAFNSQGFGYQASINGWLWPVHSRQEGLLKLIYVNGRLVKEALIANQLRQLAHHAKLEGISYALYFDLPTEWLNINVHPSKQRIKISPLNNIMAHLSHTIRLMLKTVSTAPTSDATKTVITANGDRQGIDNNTSTSTVFDSSLSKASSTIDGTQSRQVQTPKHAYEFSSSKQFLQRSAEPYVKERANLSHDNLSAASTNTVNALNSSAMAIEILPICLEVVTSLDGLADQSSYTTDIADKPLPWLLFYHQGECVLISVADWRSRVRLLFDSSIFSDTILNKGSTIDSAADINQQLTIVGRQMSAQDFTIFIADIKALLAKHAIEVIDSKRLVAVMLTSVPKHNLS